MEEKQKPVISNFDRGINMACWEQTSTEGKEFQSFTISRKYKNKAGEEKTETLHVMPDQLLPLAELCRISYTDLGAYKYKKYQAQKKSGQPVTDDLPEDDIPF